MMQNNEQNELMLLRHHALAIAFLSLCMFPIQVGAVLPPDILFSVGTQFWQIITGLGVFIAGAVFATIPFLRVWYERLRLWIGVIAFIEAVAILSLLGFLYFALNPHATSRPIATSLSHSTSTSARFFADRFVVVGKRAHGEQVLIDLRINRAEQNDETFSHYYLTDMVDGKDSGVFSDERLSMATAVLPDLLFRDFVRSTTTDHSSREQFTFTFRRFGKDYHLETEVFVDDFMTKNEPEYTQYASVGGGKLQIDKEELPVRIYHERVYSSDFHKTIFFDGFDTLHSTATQVLFWDSEGAFYLVDRSVVDGSSSSYASHIWVLTKQHDGYTKKAYAGDVAMYEEGKDILFRGVIPDVDGSTFTLRLVRSFSTERQAGYVEGEILNQQKVSKKIFGEGSFERYGE
jgi:hypothetical protein